MAGGLGQPAVRRLRRPLVDGAPRHVQRDEGPAGEGSDPDGAEGGRCLLAAPAVAQRGDAGSAGDLAMSLEHPPDGVAVPHLLERPAREERGDLGFAVGRRQEQVAQVAHRVVLDVVHVAE